MDNNMAVTHDVRVKMKEMEALKEIEKKLEARQMCNREIIKVLKQLVDDNSSLRFCQILSMLDLDKDRFNEEPIDTLKAINDKLAEF
jgi:hypothetical protein